MGYNGHKNWNHWNVSLWINNDEGLYQLAKDCMRRTKNRKDAAQVFMGFVGCVLAKKTPDGAPYSVSSVYHAMEGL